MLLHDNSFTAPVLLTLKRATKNIKISVKKGIKMEQNISETISFSLASRPMGNKGGGKVATARNWARIVVINVLLYFLLN